MKNTLVVAVEDVPLPKLSAAELWRKGRRLRCRRRLEDIAAGLFAVVIVAVFLWVPDKGSHMAAPQEATVAIPRTVAAPHFWDRWYRDSPNGPAMALFLVPHGNFADNLFGSTGVLLGRDGSYRLRSGLPPALLSPDGKYVAQEGGVLVDLTTAREKGLPAGKLLAWTRDSSALLLADDQDLFWYDWRSRQRRVLALASAKQVEDAAFSADGRKLAYTVRNDRDTRIMVVEVATGRQLFQVDLGSADLGGPAAWFPDGERVLVIKWHSAGKGSLATASEAGLQLLPRGDLGDMPGQLIGWQDGQPVLTVHERNDRTVLRRLNNDGTLTTLSTFESRFIQVPQDLIETASFGGPDVRPPDFDPARWFWYALTCVAGLLLIAFLIWRGRRWTRLLGIRRQGS